VGEGIRIIGAEEAAAALETGQAAGRRPSDAPRFGDVPPTPEGPRPAMRFPLADGESQDLSNTVGTGGTRVSPGGRSEDTPAPMPPELPHWTEPPTGEVPRILPGTPADEPEEEAWTAFTRAPRWRDQGGDWDDAAFGDASVLGDDETRLGALAESDEEPADWFNFDVDEEPRPRRIRTRVEPSAAPVRPDHGGRDNGVAIAIGCALGALFLILAKAGPRFLMVYSAVAVVLCVAEVFAVLRRAGYRPATLLALVATISLFLGAYWKGERALPLVMVLVVVFTMLWYLSGVMVGRPTINVAATLLGFVWTGFLGSYAALILRPASYASHRDGVALLLGAVLCTVANDVGAYGFGRTFGRTPLAPTISPNKTLEGYLGGMACTVLVGAGLVSRIHPFSVSKGFWLAVGVAIVAPLGDLCESMIKRDIGVKDMGRLLPGHGGLMDRLDSLLPCAAVAYLLLAAFAPV
jgi:phosphatidate cytidylyltransferase